MLRLEWEVLLRRACVIRRVVLAALARIPRYFGISAQWMRPSRAGRNYPVRRHTVFHPRHDHLHVVEAARARTTRAMLHPRNHE